MKGKSYKEIYSLVKKGFKGDRTRSINQLLNLDLFNGVDGERVYDLTRYLMSVDKIKIIKSEGKKFKDYILKWNSDKGDIDLSRFENLSSEFDSSDICITLPPYNIYGLTDYLRRMNIPMKSLLSEFTKLFESAKDSIKICSPFLEWGGFNFFKEELVKKAKEGTEISILSRELRKSESLRRYNEMRKIYHYFYKHRVQSRVEIRNYYFETEEKRLGSSIHAKLIITDDKKAYIGSGELRYNCFKKNLELGIVLSGQKVNELSLIFDRIYEKSEVIPFE